MYTKGLCIITGDFNCPNIDWRNLAATGGPNSEFLNYCITNGFCQLVTEPTRDSHILDILLVNDPLAVCDVQVAHPICGSDHNRVEFSLCNFDDVNPVDDVLHSKVYDWSTANFEGLAHYLQNVNWNELLMTHLTPDELWSGFKFILRAGIDKYVKLKFTSNMASKIISRRLYPAMQS